MNLLLFLQKSRGFVIVLLLISSFSCYPKESLDDIDFIYNRIKLLKNTNIDSVLYYSDLLNKLAKKEKLINYEYKSHIIKVKALIKSGRHLESVNICMLAKNFVEDNNLTQYSLEVNMYLGHTYLAAGFASEALKLFLPIQNQKEELSIRNQIDLDYYTGIAFMEIGDSEMAKQYLKNSIKTDIEKNNFSSSFSSFVFLATMSDNEDSIRKFYDMADSVNYLYPDRIYEKVVLLNNLALFNDALNNSELSKAQYLEAIKLSRSSKINEVLSNSLNNYAYTLIEEQKFDSAKLVLSEALGLVLQMKNMDMLGMIYDTYSDFYSSINDHELALVYMDSSVFYRNLLREQKRIKESMFISTMFETDRMEKELLFQDIKINRLIISVLTSLTILLLLIGMIFLFKQKLKFAKSKLENNKRERKLELAESLIKGQDNERRRITMDLHDGLSAQLGTLGLKIDGFMNTHEKYPDIISSVHKIHKSVRDLSHRMIPTQLEKSGLVAAINNIASSVNKAGKFSMEFETNLIARLPEKLEINIYYLIFELVNNATKHSKGNAIFVQLLKHENLISLLVEDNGDDFGSESENGIGLNNIKTRVEYLGGQFMMDIEGPETVFMIEIPI
jgi:signal transduction histidine kinase